MTQHKPKISLIISTLGRRAELERGLRSFTSQTMTDFEVIVVDQNQEGFLDDVIDRFSKELNIRWIKSERGLSRGRNAGLREARGTILGFPDDDCWYDPEVCRRVLDYFSSRPGLHFLSGRTIDREGIESVSQFRATPGEIQRRDVFNAGNSNCFFLKREIALAIGGFDERLGLGASNGPQSGEETDLLLRCINRGLETYYDPAFIVRHDQVTDDRTEKTLHRTEAYSIGFGHLIRKHGFGPAYLCYRVARSTAKAIIYAGRLDFWNARLRVVWAAGTVRGFFMRTVSPVA